MQHLDSLERIVRERLPAELGLSIVEHSLGNPVRVEYVEEVRRRLQGKVVGARIRPSGGSPPTTLSTAPDNPAEVRYEQEGKPVRLARLEPRDSVSLLVATRGYGQYLPAVLTQGAQSEHGTLGGDFLKRYLLLFQTLNFEVERRVEGRGRIVDPVRMDPKFLPWLASWVDFTLDERIPVTRRRIFLRRAVELFQWRGTVFGVGEMIKTLTGLTAEIVPRRGPQPMELGNCALARPRDEDAALRLPYVTHAGEHLLVSPRFAAAEYFTIVLANRDVLVAQFQDRLVELLEQVARVAQHERPAHLQFVICFKDEESTQGGLVLAGEGQEVLANSVLGRACLLG